MRALGTRWQGAALRLAMAMAMVGGLALSRVARGAELHLDFARMPLGGAPSNFVSAVTGEGGPGDWRIVQVDAVSRFPTLEGGAAERTVETVLAQISTDPADERFPLLIYEPAVFADFTATLKFRTVSGQIERMAGLAFRVQDPTNYYVVRASSLGNTFRFYKFVDGARSEPIGPEIPIPSGEWHTLEVTCKGNAIQCRLNGAEAIPSLTDTSFSKGRIALWTKSDAVSHFASLRVVYDLVQTLPERLVSHATNRYPRLRGLTVYARRGDRIEAVAASESERVGSEGGAAEALALDKGQVSAGGSRDHAEAVFPLRDRNGDPLFAVRLRLRTFRGQTDSNIAARGKLIADTLQALVRSAEDGRE